MNPEETERAREAEFHIHRAAFGLAARIIEMAGAFGVLYGADEVRDVMDQLAARFRDLSKEVDRTLFTHAWEGIIGHDL